MYEEVELVEESEWDGGQGTGWVDLLPCPSSSSSSSSPCLCSLRLSDLVWRRGEKQEPETRRPEPEADRELTGGRDIGRYRLREREGEGGIEKERERKKKRESEGKMTKV